MIEGALDFLLGVVAGAFGVRLIQVVRAWPRRRVERLTPRQRRRQAKFLYWQGWTFAQIARHVKVSEADVAAWREDDDWGDQRRERRNG